MRNPIEQAGHVAYEVGYFLFATGSRIVNAVWYKGSIHQTLSARTHMDSKTSLEWLHRKWRINKVFFWQEDHCAGAWDSEVSRARKTLQRNGEL
jgi:hypothetical protein